MSAFPQPNSTTDILDKIEFLQLPGSECQHLPMKNVKHMS